MKLLLDTHIWLWSQLDPTKLSQRVSRALKQAANELWLSPLSVWEAVLLAEKGRVLLTPTAEQWVIEALREAPVKEAALTWEVVLATKDIDLLHRDPVDRFLAATARVFDLTLVTADKRILQGTGFATLPNR